MTDGQIRSQIAASRWQLAAPHSRLVIVPHAGHLQLHLPEYAHNLDEWLAAA